MDSIFKDSSNIRTGDVLLFSGNSPTGFLLRTFVSSEWNHSGIAVRFTEVRDKFNQIKKVISLTEEGELYVLETNTGIRKDEIYGDDIVGVGFSRADWVFLKYNRIAVRRLHDIFRTDTFGNLTMDFSSRYRGSRFPSNSLPFISVWLGIALNTKEDTSKEDTSNEMFCSEFMAYYYAYCIGQQYQDITGTVFDNNLDKLFGEGSPKTENMFTPGHYSYYGTPNAPIFLGKEDIIYVSYADIWYVILQPLIIILAVMLWIWLSLP